MPICIPIEIYHMKPDTMFHLAFAQDHADAVAHRRILFQIIRHMLRDQDVPRIAAIHHPLRDVDAGAGNVRLLR